MTLQFEEGHDFIFRVTATMGGKEPQSNYYVSPHKAAFWRDQLRKTGYESTVGLVPHSAFLQVDDATLDEMAKQEREKS